MTMQGRNERLMLRRRGFGMAALALGAAAVRTPSAAAEGPAERLLADVGGDLTALKEDAREEAAYFLGLEPYVYGFPLVMMDATNRIVTAVPKAGGYSAPYNQVFRMPGIVPPEYKTVVRVSVNSVWSGSILDLGAEPVVFSYPESDGRYFVVQLLNNWTDDLASAGTRTTGNAGGRFLVAGPGWDGAAPPGVGDVHRSTTRYAWVLVQMAAAGPRDFPAIHELQARLRVTPLSAWGKPYTPPDDVPVDPDVDLTATPYDHVRLMTGERFFARLATLLKDSPPYPADGPMLEKLKRIGVEPGKPFGRGTVDPAILRGLDRVPPAVWLKLQTGPSTMADVNGWINIPNLGRYGTDYATRAFTAYAGLGALTSEDAVYPTAFVDGDGDVLDGASQYVLRFAKDEAPPSESGVWSVSPYRENFYVRNAIDRYGITSGMPLERNADGSLDIHIQARSPGADREANWLPCPPSGPFNLTIRVYQPKKSLLDGSYKIPPVTKVKAA